MSFIRSGKCTRNHHKKSWWGDPTYALSGSFALERVLKERFKPWRLRGEWYAEEILPDVLALLADDAGWYASTA